VKDLISSVLILFTGALGLTQAIFISYVLLGLSAFIHLLYQVHMLKSSKRCLLVVGFGEEFRALVTGTSFITILFDDFLDDI
jgi:hypothetical protein